MMDSDEIEEDALCERRHLIPRVASFQEKMSGQRHLDDTYEMLEMAPDIFKNIRKIHNVSDDYVKKIFSLININKLDIRISSGKGGAFFIEPLDGARLLIKSITKPEYEIIQGMLQDYYSYLLMNPNTYLSPILGVYKLKI